MDDIFQGALKELTQTQVKFLCGEFGMTEDSLLTAEESFLDEIYDSLCDMEVDEITKAGDNDLSDRGKIVSDIVTTFGNAIADACGYSDDFEDDLDA